MKSQIYGLLLLTCRTCLEFMRAEDNEGFSATKERTFSDVSEYDYDDHGGFDTMEDNGYRSKSWLRRMRRNCKPGLWCKKKGFQRSKY